MNYLGTYTGISIVQSIGFWKITPFYCMGLVSLIVVSTNMTTEFLETIYITFDLQQQIDIFSSYYYTKRLRTIVYIELK